jgi:hypothetical protein
VPLELSRQCTAQSAHPRLTNALCGSAHIALSRSATCIECAARQRSEDRRGIHRAEAHTSRREYTVQERISERGVLFVWNALRASVPCNVAERSPHGGSLNPGTQTPMRFSQNFVLDMKIRFGMGRSRKCKIQPKQISSLKTGNGDAPRGSAPLNRRGNAPRESAHRRPAEHYWHSGRIRNAHRIAAGRNIANQPQNLTSNTTKRVNI